MSIEHAPSPYDAVENDSGDIIPLADRYGLEGVCEDAELLSGDNTDFDESGFDDQAALAAGRIFSDQAPVEAHETFEAAAQDEENRRRYIKQEYDKKDDEVEKLVEKGIDREVAWVRVDKTGIRYHYNQLIEQEEREQQDAINHAYNTSIQEALLRQKRAAAQQVADPIDQARIDRELLARDRARQERRFKRA